LKTSDGVAVGLGGGGRRPLAGKVKGNTGFVPFLEKGDVDHRRKDPRARKNSRISSNGRDNLRRVLKKVRLMQNYKVAGSRPPGADSR